MNGISNNDAVSSSVTKIENWKCIVLGDAIEKVLDNRGKTPPLSKEPTSFRLLEVNSITAAQRSPDLTKVVKWVDESTYNSWFRAGHPKANDILIPTVGSIGEASQVSEAEGICIAQNLVALRFKPGFYSQYFYYLITSPIIVNQIHRVVMNGVQPSLKVPYLKDFHVTVPRSVFEQKKITRILSSVDSKLALIDQQITTTQTLKKGLMQKLFTQGVGTQDADGRWQPHTEFHETEFGWIPKTWDVNTLISKCSVIKDGTHFSPKSKDGPCLYITSKNIRFGRMDLTDVAYISEEEHKAIYAGSPVKQGDVLLTKDGANTGNAAINTLAREFSLLSSVAFLRGQPTHLDNNFLLQLLLSPNSQQMIKSEMAGQAITRLTLKKISSFKFAFPPLEEQQEISRILSTVDRKLENLQFQKAQTQQLKKGLMQKLLTGQIRVQPDPQDH